MIPLKRRPTGPDGQPAASEHAPPDAAEREMAELEPIDLGPPTAVIATPRSEPYNPEPRRENIRGIVALASVALFAATVAVILVVVALGTRTWDDMEGVTAAVLPAVTTLMGSTVGFYFGTQDRRDGR